MSEKERVIVELYIKDMRVNYICSVLDINARKLYEVLKKYGVKLRRQGASAERV